MSEQNDPQPIQNCPSCGGTMNLAKIIPKLGGLPKLKTFQCVNCNDVITIEDDE